MSYITASEYWQEIAEIVEQVKDEVEEYGNDVYGIAHEIVDSHKWNIWYYYSADIIENSDNDDVFADYGVDLNVMYERRGIDGILNFIALQAMLADVCQDLLVGIE